MPIREYHCRRCGHEFEVIEGPSSEQAECEVCGEKDLERMLSVFAAQVSTPASRDLPCADCTCPGGQCPMEN